MPRYEHVHQEKYSAVVSANPAELSFYLEDLKARPKIRVLAYTCIADESSLFFGYRLSP